MNGSSKSSQKKKQLEATEELGQEVQQEHGLPREETGRLEAAGSALQAERRIQPSRKKKQFTDYRE